MRFVIIFCLMLFFQCSFAEELYPFQDAKKEQQFHSLIQELRCVVCQNESLDASNAELAQQLRGDVYRMVQAGDSDQQIKNYLVERYGDFILFKPKFSENTYFLWLAPFLLLILGFVVLFFMVRKKSSSFPRKRE